MDCYRSLRYPVWYGMKVVDVVRYLVLSSWIPILATIAKALPLIPFFDQLWLNTIKIVIILVVVVVNIVVLAMQLTKMH